MFTQRTCDQRHETEATIVFYSICYGEGCRQTENKEGEVVVAGLLSHSEKFFAEPKRLPPKWNYHHKAPLLPGSLPVCSRPYRHPYLHKNEIER